MVRWKGISGSRFLFRQWNFDRKKKAKIDQTIDLKNGYVIPPLAEAHTHKLDLAAEVAEQEAQFVKEGVMYVMVMTNGANNAARNRAHFNRPNTIDVLYANGGITYSGQHPSFAYERIASGIAQWWLPENTKIIQASRKEENNSYWFFDTIADVDKKWNSPIASRPGLVKIYMLDVKNNAPAKKSITEEVIAAIVKRAYSAGLRVAVHIETFEDLKLGIKYGVDIFAHSPHYNVFFSKTEPPQPTFTADELKTIRSNKIALIPTLSLNEDFAIVRDACNNYQGRFDAVRFNQVVEFQKKTIETLRNAGFVLAIGSDRDSLVPELNYWLKNKIFNPLDALNIATFNTPQLIYPKRKIGRLQEGYEASFLVLEKNPLEDLDALKKISLRYKQGYLLDAAK